MLEPDTLPIMTPVELKSLEGQKILPLLGANAALPSAGLVYSGSSGAPFFAAALACAAAAYLFWILTDALYYQQLLIAKTRHRKMARRPLERAAVINQRFMTGYTILSIVLTLVGFAGVHGTFRFPVTVFQGFALLVPFFAIMIVQGVAANERKNRLFVRVRALRERAMPVAQEQGP